MSGLYPFFASLHRALYTSGLKKSVHLSKPLLSVGNLTYGGTGKTPFVVQLVEDFKTLGLKPAVIVKSYKAQTKISSLLDQAKSLHPEVWGDEACWYFNKLQVPIYSGPRKWETATLAQENKDIDILILDDGFQHHKLYKNFNIVLIDALAGTRDLKFRARENLSALQYADVVILTRANLVSSDTLQELKSLLPLGKPYFLSFIKMFKLRNFLGQEMRLQNERVGLVSGIANPDSFLSVFRQNFPKTQVMTLEFSDHHEYGKDDLIKIENFKKNNKLDFIIITEKDEVKLKKIAESIQIPIGVMQVEFQFQNLKEWQVFLKGLIQ